MLTGNLCRILLTEIWFGGRARRESLRHKVAAPSLIPCFQHACAGFPGQLGGLFVFWAYRHNERQLTSRYRTLMGKNECAEMGLFIADLHRPHWLPSTEVPPKAESTKLRFLWMETLILQPCVLWRKCSKVMCRASNLTCTDEHAGRNRDSKTMAAGHALCKLSPPSKQNLEHSICSLQLTEEIQPGGLAMSTCL